MANLKLSKTNVVKEEKTYTLNEGSLVLLIGYTRTKYSRRNSNARGDDQGEHYNPVVLATFERILDSEEYSRPRILLSNPICILPDEEYRGIPIPLARHHAAKDSLEYGLSYETEIISGRDEISNKLDSLGMHVYASLIKRMS